MNLYKHMYRGNQTRGNVDFFGNSITFSNFGALVMLVPLLEVCLCIDIY
jgi:hypothetical protein